MHLKGDFFGATNESGVRLLWREMLNRQKACLCFKLINIIPNCLNFGSYEDCKVIFNTMEGKMSLFQLWLL